MSAENRLKATLALCIARLDDLEAQARVARQVVDNALKDLARERGVTFLRLESFRDEIRRSGE
jgi:hypothetical protein